MIPWAGFIGKFIDFFLSKIGRVVDDDLDHKKRAAKAFLKLFETIETIEEVTTEFLMRVAPVVKGKKARLYSAWFTDIAQKLDTASTDFLKEIGELRSIVAIWDPQLADMLSVLGREKEDRASSFSELMKFNIEWEGSTLKRIIYSAPAQLVVAEDFERTYRAIPALARKDLMRSLVKAKDFEKTYRAIPALTWPKDLLRSLVEQNLVEGTIIPDNVDQIKWIYEQVSPSVPTIVAARERLGSFIRNNFSLEDLLYTKRLA
jgi:hypothetical protein